MGRRSRPAVRGAERCRVDRPVGLDAESFVDDPADSAQHWVVAGQKHGDSLADIERNGGLSADAGFGHVADRYIELAEPRAGKRALYQTRLTRLALLGGDG